MAFHHLEREQVGEKSFDLLLKQLGVDRTCSDEQDMATSYLPGRTEAVCSCVGTRGLHGWGQHPS